MLLHPYMWKHYDQCHKLWIITQQRTIQIGLVGDRNSLFPDIQEKCIRRPQLEDGVDVLQLRMVAANIPNKQSRTVNDGVLSLGVWGK